MKYTIALASLAISLAGCATTAPEPEAPAEPVYLSDQEFETLRVAANRNNGGKATDDALTGLMARDDLTIDQRARLYLDRGFTRGIFVRDYPMAFPQCAVVEFREMERLSPNHPHLNRMKENREYQFYRFQYFPEAPESCKQTAEVYRQEIGDCLGLRDENGTCIVEWK